MGDFGEPCCSTGRYNDLESLKAPSYHSRLCSLPGFTLPSVQRAVVTPEVKPTLSLVVTEVPIRPPLPNEVIVRICFSGICRSDACFATGPQPGFPTRNHIAGHEGIGQVVQAHGPELLGRFVGLRYLGSTCGHCRYCLDGLPTSCPRQMNAPKQLDGSFQEYLTVEADSLLVIPDHLVEQTPNLASLCGALCSGSAALMAVRAARIGAQDVVVVVGAAGAIGHYAAMMARNLYGAKVIGVETEAKVALCKERGIDDHLDAMLPAPAADSPAESWAFFFRDLVECCTRLRPDKAVARAANTLIVAASTASAFRNLEGYVCDGGRIVCSGVPYGLQLSLSIHDLVERGLHITGTLMGGPAVSLEVMRHICDGQIRPWTNLVSLGDIPRQMQALVHCETLGKVVAAIQEPLVITGSSPEPI